MEPRLPYLAYLASPTLFYLPCLIYLSICTASTTMPHLHCLTLPHLPCLTLHHLSFLTVHTSPNLPYLPCLSFPIPYLLPLLIYFSWYSYSLLSSVCPLLHLLFGPIYSLYSTYSYFCPSYSFILPHHQYTHSNLTNTLTNTENLTQLSRIPSVPHLTNLTVVTFSLTHMRSFLTSTHLSLEGNCRTQHANDIGAHTCTSTATLVLSIPLFLHT